MPRLKLDLDDIVKRLLAVRSEKPGTNVALKEAEVIELCDRASTLFLLQPNLLLLEAPVRIVGDIHGQYFDLLRIFEYGGFPPAANYLFLGDYVDRGPQGIECTCLLLAFKLLFPNNFFMLRGNHEVASINRVYGFYEEVKSRFSSKVWKAFTHCFNCLPTAAIVGSRIFCIHGGLSPQLSNVKQINDMKRPSDVTERGMLCDFLWSDPDPTVSGWQASDRGVSYLFGSDVVSDFLEKNQFDLIVRAHQVVEDGYEFFGPNRQLVTVFSAPNYVGEFDNAGAIMNVGENLLCSFQVFLA